MSYCNSCGAELEEGTMFCTNCGEPVQSDTSASEESGSSPQTENQTVVGDLDPNVAAALSYLLGFITGLIFFLVEDEDAFVRFHAAQSIVVFGGIFVLYFIFSVVSGIITTATIGTVGFMYGMVSLLFSLIWLVISLGSLGLWIYLMVTAYQGNRTEIPLAAGIAKDFV